jgi:hypothetical protein
LVELFAIIAIFSPAGFDWLCAGGADWDPHPANIEAAQVSVAATVKSLEVMGEII